MKKIFIILFVSIAMQINIAAQYFPFPTDSVSWTNIGYINEEPADMRDHFGLLGDTTFNGIQYSKMYLNPNWSNGVQNTYDCFYRPTAIYVAGIREDENKKVWYFPPNDSMEYLLYDFDLNVGDTFCSNIEQPATGDPCFQVTYIDSVLINGSLRRRTNFDADNGSESWIEGIGSTTYSLLAQWNLIGNVGSAVHCYYENDELIYGDSLNCICSTDTAIEEPQIQKNNLKIFPNPFEDQINIEFSLQQSSTVVIEIVNSAGISVLHQPKNLLQGNHSIELNESLPTGIYFVNLKIGDQIMNYKIVK